MIGRHSQFSMWRKGVAWAAAYALVLQVMLMSALGAGLAGRALDGATGLAALASTPLCVNGQPGGDDDAPAKAAAHCPLCLSRVDAAVLPPPVATPELDRYAIELHYRVLVREGLRAAAPQHRPHQPRAPPAFA
ncbi:DUF2946 family protein [Xanthobacter sediminis]|uniref:DUF2946 family protein n=1 Tax=Xanthobacter sediminis TaxID=3119926 RepID=UPI003728F43A